MKKYINIALTMVLLFVMTGCINHGLDEIDTYDSADITSVEGVYYRYTTDKIMDVSGEAQVRQVALQMVSPEIDKEAGTVNLTVKPASNFPADELDKLSDTRLVVCLNISVASIIRPTAGSVKLGVPADWSKPNTYIITAADGSTKEWTVTIKLQK